MTINDGQSAVQVLGPNCRGQCVGASRAGQLRHCPGTANDEIWGNMDESGVM